MDKFQHSDNISLNRRDLFNALQNMIYGNIDKLIRGIYDYGNLKIICGNSEKGLLSTSDFQVTCATATVSVNVGVATNDDTSLIYNAIPQTYSVATKANGQYYVWVKYKQAKALIGSEVPLPTKGAINTDNLYTMLTDSAEIGVDAAVPTGGIALARVAVLANVIPAATNANYGNLSRDLYVGEVSGLLPRTGGSWPSYANQFTESYAVARINDEYIRINSSGIIQERGYLNTIVEHHASGSAITVLSIIDMRQDNLLLMRGSDAIEKAAARGITLVGSDSRTLCVRHLKRHSSAPTIASATTPVIWVNRSGHMWMITDRVKDAYYGIQTAATNVSNYKAIIADLRYRILGADDTEVAALNVEMRKAQQDLISANNLQQEMLAAITNDEISGYMRSSPNIFNYVVEVTHSTMGTDGIIQYEAEVTRSPLASMSETYNLALMEKYYSTRVMPTGYVNGDAVYPALPAAEYTGIKIPISIGERVTVRVRPINENGIYGGYSNTLSYEFVRYDDSEYIAYQNIYDLIVPNILTSVSTLREYVAYIKDMWEQMSSTNEQIRAYQTELNDLRDRVVAIEGDMVGITPLIPAVPRLLTVAQTYVQPTQPTMN